MGQAKLRGSYEQRSTQAQQRLAAERAERERKEAEAKAAEMKRVAEMPPEQRERYKARRHNRHLMLATAFGMLASMSEPPRRK